MTTETTEQQRARNLARQYLGPRYAQRLLAAYSVIVDGEGLFKRFGARDPAYSEVAQAFRELREAGDIDF